MSEAARRRCGSPHGGGWHRAGIVACDPGRHGGPMVRDFHVAFLIDFPIVVEPGRVIVRFGPNPQGSILPPSERGRRLGRRPRSFVSTGRRLSRSPRHRVVAAWARRQGLLNPDSRRRPGDASPATTCVARASASAAVRSGRVFRPERRAWRGGGRGSRLVRQVPRRSWFHVEQGRRNEGTRSPARGMTGPAG